MERMFCGDCGTSFTYYRYSRGLVVDVNLATVCEEQLGSLEEWGVAPKRHGGWCWGVDWWKGGFVDAAEGKGRELLAWGKSEGESDGKVEFGKGEKKE